ncbi:MAG: sulfotransferase family 2 domain-containing protein [Gammaproteobacteria bacterium]|nr:sulfotransferase family 2 domain-containing protein [Gammaproteobacteria bacterium]
MIDHKRKLLFIHIARTGGSSVETALVGGDWWTIDPGSKHISASQARALYGEEIWQSYTKFSIVRNPWDRLVSMWATGWWWGATTHLKGKEPPSFQHFLMTLQPHPHEFYRSLHYHEILDEPLDAIIRFENLEAGFEQLMNSVNVNGEAVQLPHVQRRARAAYSDYYDDATRQLVAERYSRDIAAFGYEF